MLLKLFIISILLSFIDISEAIICKCESCGPSSTTCETNEKCFISYEKDTKTYSYGCSDGHFEPFLCKRSSKSKVITHCCNTTLCNENYSIVPTEEPVLPKPDNILDKFIENTTFLQKCLIFISTLVVIGVLSMLFLAFCNKRQNQNNYKKEPIESKNSASSFPFLESGQSSRQLIDRSSSSGSGSGLPILVPRSIAIDVKMLELIGKGRFGQVWRATWKGEAVAVKIFTTREDNSYKREVEVYQTYLIQHDNILQFKAADIFDNGINHQLWLITKYHEKGSLYDYLSKNVLNMSELIRMAYSIANGLAHLHMEILGNSHCTSHCKPAIAHRDFKSKNILVKNDGECVIADLGMAVKLVDDKVDIPINNKREGTKRYLAPEVLDGSIDTNRFDSFRRADMYAFGLVCWELATRTCFNDDIVCNDYKIPYEDMVDSDPSIEQMKQVVVNEGKRPPQSASWETDEKMKVFSRIMIECWYPDPAARLTALYVRKTISKLDKNPIELS